MTALATMTAEEEAAWVAEMTAPPKIILPPPLREAWVTWHRLTYQLGRTPTTQELGKAQGIVQSAAWFRQERLIELGLMVQQDDRKKCPARSTVAVRGIAIDRAGVVYRLRPDPWGDDDE